MADTLLDWFSSLASPVIPEKCTSKLEKGEKIDSEFVKAFMNMVCAVIIFILIIIPLRFLLLLLLQINLQSNQ